MKRVPVILPTGVVDELWEGELVRVIGDRRDLSSSLMEKRKICQVLIAGLLRTDVDHLYLLFKKISPSPI